MQRPATLNCDHSGCQECWAKLLALTTLPKCPQCQSVIDSDVELKVCVALNDMTRSLTIECTNEGCDWKGPLETADVHSNRCEFMKVQCQNDGCNEELLRRYSGTRQQHCPRQEISCADCWQVIARECLPHHLSVLCSHKSMSCPLGCELIFPR